MSANHDPLSPTQRALRALRCSMAGVTRRLPRSVPGRIGVGARVDRCLRALGYSAWRERVRCIGNYEMILETDEEQQRQVFWGGLYEPEVVHALAGELPPDGVLLDVGANVGTICLGVLSVAEGRGGRPFVHAVEPLGINYRRLREHVVMNGLEQRIDCHRFAFGDHRGEVNLLFGDDAPGTAGITGAGGEEGIRSHIGSSGEIVPMVILDEWTEEVGLTRLDAIKIDIEGAEPLFFRGAMETIKRHRPVIFGEFNDWWSQRLGLSIFDDCFEPLRALGYTASRWNAANARWLPVASDAPPGPDMQDLLWKPSGPAERRIRAE